MTRRFLSRAFVAIAIIAPLGLYAGGTRAQDQTPPKLPTLPAFLRDLPTNGDDESESAVDEEEDEDYDGAPKRRTQPYDPQRDAKIAESLREHNLDFLALEREFKRVAPELARLLPAFAEFSRRLPARWGSLGLSSRQTKDIYRIEEEYHNEISQLQARIDRLTEERNEKLLEILTEKQKTKLERILKDAVDVKVGKKKKDDSNARLERP